MAASLAALSRSPQYGAFRLPADPLIGWRLRNTFLEFIDDENTAELECPTMRRALSVDSGMALLRRANFTQWEFTEAAPRHASQFPGTEDKLALPESPASIITKESVHVKASAEIAFNEAGDMKRATRLRPSRRGRRAGGMLQQQATQWMPENTPSPQSNVPSQTMNNFEPSATAPCREGTGVLVLPPKMQQWNMETQQMMNQEQLMQTFQQQQMQSQQVQATKRGSRGKGTNGSVSVQQQQQQQHMMQHQVQQQMHQQQPMMQPHHMEQQPSQQVYPDCSQVPDTCQHLEQRNNDALQEPASQATTVMIRNIACQYTQERVMEFLDQAGLHGMYDFVYLPLNSTRRANLGYMFVNFVSMEAADMCKELLTGKVFGTSRTEKRCEVSIAHVQGPENIARHFHRKAVLRSKHAPVFVG
eukprot:gnl/TRDRNA2_/TRDRNA2_169306_c5_seq2.p1 gnl/TRDRNA2_/TRDRNA2_169306_c5~~gnl/TRDRNA2_/TRDRNA2_169306_c5_seq2.p1  ORF type:complete len:417 (-),score=100.15 gnl/TRDRNA2_/TRDRNA2_169306_c5_seq2:201-1451(-)